MLFILIVLAIETVESAGVIENGEVLVPIFRTPRNRILGITTPRSCRTDEIPDAIVQGG